MFEYFQFAWKTSRALEISWELPKCFFVIQLRMGIDPMIEKNLVTPQKISGIAWKIWSSIFCHFQLPIMAIENGDWIFFNRLCWQLNLWSNTRRNLGNNQTFFQSLD
jgi:hypothetical protein